MPDRSLLFCVIRVLAVCGCAAVLRAASPDLEPIRKWLAKQDAIRSVSAEFLQSRALRTLRHPLVNRGRIWFRAPDAFRWELGSPPKLVVLRKGDSIYRIDPARKRAERSPVGTVTKRLGGEGLGMMNFPFARDLADFQRRFELLDLRADGAVCHVDLLPRNARARAFLASIGLDFEVESGRLMAIAFATREGSSVRQEFRNVAINPKLDAALFDYDLSGYKIVDVVE